MKVALIQHKYHDSKDSTIEVTVKMIGEASTNGADLIVLQELHEREYFCQSENVKYFDYASSFDNDIEFWSSVAKNNNVVIVASLFEKRTGGLYHNTAVVFDRDGSMAGKYRKMHIPDDPGFYEKFYFTPGDLGFEPIDTSVGRLGVLICWDQWYPEAARIMALRGAEVLIYPTAIGWLEEDDNKEKLKQLNSWMTIQQSHAIANSLPVISCNRVGFEKDFSGVIDGIKFWGHSFVCDARGEVVSSADEEEMILYAIIEHQETKKTRDIWPFLRDRRIDGYGCLLKRYCD